MDGEKVVALPKDMDLFGIPIEREVIARLKALADADRARPIHERRFTARGRRFVSPRSVARHLILDALFLLPDCPVDSPNDPSTDRAA